MKGNVSKSQPGKSVCVNSSFSPKVLGTYRAEPSRYFCEMVQSTLTPPRQLQQGLGNHVDLCLSHHRPQCEFGILCSLRPLRRSPRNESKIRRRQQMRLQGRILHDIEGLQGHYVRQT